MMSSSLLLLEPAMLDNIPSAVAAAAKGGFHHTGFHATGVVATCLLKGAFGLADLLPGALVDPVTLDLAGRVTCAVDPDLGLEAHTASELAALLRRAS
jgi:hypothetical protein